MSELPKLTSGSWNGYDYVVTPGPGAEYHQAETSWWLPGNADYPVWIIVKAGPVPEGQPLGVMEINDADGWEGEVWSAAADFGRGCWVWRKADPHRLTYEHDMATLVDPFDDERCIYIAIAAYGAGSMAAVVPLIDTYWTD